MKAVPTPKKITSARGNAPFIKDMVDDKKIIFAYFRGEISIDELNARGIKLG
ncbi:hypothetical protein [Runella slithyformis]|uniref:Uncharacterized protein n=1 Tax=Runella slithyformis (strain ATCC 29530 / DSM 19594 / LMG 11500 / NCIMB 11436 / LSU 4) TaxID=761193 RepID=A0A7U4E6G6_RUNSL|nr:hypothetical protein [Runella slithyformis]AEI49184.1 hypothetical protein Runsl_2791 [Runella slithyformis DSM 19594]